jgi:hypothetical protein
MLTRLLQLVRKQAASGTGQQMLARISDMLNKPEGGAAVHEVIAGPETPMGSAEANEALRKLLRAHGDDGRSVRSVQHYIYPSKDRTPRAEETVITYLASYDGAARDGAGGLIFEHDTTLAPEVFDAFTARLQRDLARLGWDYDGWESAVTTSEERTG